ncbi:unnamed protein product [Closterium sp. NIES-53]
MSSRLLVVRVHGTNIALRYFLARELQQRGQLRLAYVASEANTADIFTKALAPGDHQSFCTMLACFALLDWSCDLFRTTVEMKRWAVSLAVIDFLQAVKCAIFVSRSTTTMIASFLLATAGNHMTKSIATCCQAHSGGGIGCNSPAGRFRDDFMSWQVGHDGTCRCTSVSISGQ